MSNIVIPDGGNIGSASDTDAIAISASGAVTFSKDINPNNFVGMIAPFGMSSVPTGWLACDGSAVSRSTYADLFTAIGTTWGAGDGSSTFALPDLEGAFLRGTGSNNTHNMADGNDFAGPSVGSFENDQMQNHKHSIYSSISGATGTGSGAVNYAAASPGSFQHYPYSSEMAESNHPSAEGTPRVGDETRPFNAGVKYCIKF